MATRATKSAFWRGLRAGTPFILGVVPFGMLFGVFATDAGLSLLETMSMTVLVVAGAAQFAALAQMQDNAPIFMVLAASLAVNLRMAMYSAAIAPHLGAAPLWQRAVAAYILVDNTYAVGVGEFEQRPAQTIAAKMAFYFGCAVPAWLFWYGASFAGAWLGKSIPPALALDFAPAIIFISIAAMMLRTWAHVAAAATSVIAALSLAFLPFSSGLLIAAALAMIVGGEVERRRE